MHKYTAPGWARTIYDLSGKLTEDFGGGPRQLIQRTRDEYTDEPVLT